MNNRFDIRLSDNDYFDFYLSDNGLEVHSDNTTIGTCSVVLFDFNNNDTFTNYPNIDTIQSLYQWDKAINDGYSFDTLGLTGLDNGLLLYDKDYNDPKNVGLVDKILDSTLDIDSNNKSLILNRVSGSTKQFIYPIDLVFDTEIGANVIELGGGFYQGYYKIDGSSYEVVPNRVNRGWVVNLNLKKGGNTLSGDTLNNKYPDNEGFFFYMGTRAENKYWSEFYGNNTGCTVNCESDSGCTDTVTQFCTEIKETDVVILDPNTNLEIFLSPPQLVYKEIENQFLIYGRAATSSRCSYCGTPTDSDKYGKETVCSFTGKSITITDYKRSPANSDNQFLIYGRARTSSRCSYCGTPTDSDKYGKETVCTFNRDGDILTELDKDLDIIDNAIGFRITNDGRIGYRKLIFTGYCVEDKYVTGVTIQEEYTENSVVPNDEWVNITVRYYTNIRYTDEELKCLPRRKGKLMIYVNCKLKAVFNDFDEFIARRLDEFSSKQIGVPYNFSLGGGSQGLLENMTFDGPDPRDLGLTIEKYFAGTFIGRIYDFKFNICDNNWCEISSNCSDDCG